MCHLAPYHIPLNDTYYCSHLNYDAAGVVFVSVGGICCVIAVLMAACPQHAMSDEAERAREYLIFLCVAAAFFLALAPFGFIVAILMACGWVAFVVFCLVAFAVESLQIVICEAKAQRRGGTMPRIDEEQVSP